MSNWSLSKVVDLTKSTFQSKLTNLSLNHGGVIFGVRCGSSCRGSPAILTQSVERPPEVCRPDVVVESLSGRAEENFGTGDVNFLWTTGEACSEDRGSLASWKVK